MNLSHSTVQRRARLLLLSLLLLLVGLAAIADGWKTDNRLAAWGGGAVDDPAHALLLERFGGDEMLLVRGHFSSAQGLRAADALAARLADLPAVHEVLDPLNLPGATPGSPEERLSRALERPIVRALDLVGVPAAEFAGAPTRLDWLVSIDPAAEPPARAELDRALVDLRAEEAAEGLTLVAAGHPLVSAALDREALAVQRRFAPLLVLVAALAAWALWRSLGLVAAALLPAVIASVGAQATLALLGHPSNMILVAVGPLVLVLMLAAQAHGVVQYAAQRSAGVPPQQAVEAAWQHTWMSVCLAALTTAVGFLVFLTSPVRAVRELGITVGLAMAIGVPLAYWAMPTLLVGLAPNPPLTRATRRLPWHRLALFALRHPRWVGGLALAVLALGAFAPSRLPIGGDGLDFFPEGHPVRQEFLEIEAEGGALSGLEVLLPGRYRAVDRARLEAFGAALEATDSVARVFGPPEVVADVEHLSGPLAALLLPEALERSGRSDQAGEWLHWSLRVRDRGGANLARISEQVQQVAAQAATQLGLAAPVTTGGLALVVRLQTQLVHTLAVSLIGTALVSLIAFALLMRRLRPLLAAAVANAVPVAVVLAATWLLGFALDAATVMVASVVLGLAVDNTFHLLHAGRPGSGDRPLPSALRAFDRIGGAAAFSTLALVAGFAVLTLSGFTPTARFGLLCAIGSAAAFVADFVVLPLLWISAPAATRAAGSTPPGPGTSRTRAQTALDSAAP